MVHDTQTLHVSADAWDRVQGYSLVVLEGPDTGKRLESGAERCSFGTHESNDMSLGDSMVSRFHCELHIQTRLPRISDLESKNGTFVDGVRIRDAYLKSNSLIKLGQTLLRFEFGGTSKSKRIPSKTECGTLVGVSSAMRTLFDVIERIAPTDSTILLEGETGTGKGITAETIHGLSPRRDKPFEVVDCGALVGNILESELFGHERGAFTGAVSRRIGAFEAAHGGTIFLDEIGELPLELQPKLLRALEEKQIRRVGGSSAQKVDVRVIAATNRDLRKEVNEGRFRSDLFYRLAVIHLRVPPLRERPEDIALLVDRLLKTTSVSCDCVAAALRSPDFIMHLQRAAWPGNVRELRNHLHRCLVLEQALRLGEAEVPKPVSGSPASASTCDPHVPYNQARLQSLLQWERQYVEALLNLHRGNIEEAAQSAGISRAYIYRLLSRHGIRRNR
jgi:transcriptional regulator with GAF, ATPase, and Fis domain